MIIRASLGQFGAFSTEAKIGRQQAGATAPAMGTKPLAIYQEVSGSASRSWEVEAATLVLRVLAEFRLFWTLRSPRSNFL